MNNQRDYTPIESIDEVISQHKKTIKKLIKNLNLDYPGFELVKKAVNNKDIHTACQEILNYYKQNRNYSWVNFDNFNDNPYSDIELEDIPDDIFTFQNVRAKIPRLKNGHLDWSCVGPNLDKEFGYFLNRHHYFYILYSAYRKTKDQKYVAQFNNLMQDWLIANPRPRRKRSTVQWRTLETALRIGNAWIFDFFGFQEEKEFSPATRLLMLASIPDHATYCKKYVVPGGNIRVMIMNSLGTMGALWPEFKDSKNWVKYALKILLPEISEIQIYPDGPQKELTNHYHYVAVKHFGHFQKMLKRAKVPIPKIYNERMEAILNYYAYNMRPNGYGLQNNDSDYDHTRPRILKASEDYERTDWKYIATNGKEGDLPSQSSVVFPWAGHIIMRNHFKTDADWCFFDFGPFGTGHQHRDKLHISIHSHGRDLLKDSGRYRYIRDKWRTFFRGTSAHNTILIDNKGQKPYKKENKKPENPDSYYLGQNYDYAVGTYDSGYQGLNEPITHTRGVLYIKNGFWIVIDNLKLKKPHKIQVLWHFNPDSHIKIVDNQVFSTDDGKPNIRIKPKNISGSEMKWNIREIKGAEQPEIQGWYSEEYNIKVPNSCIIYESSIREETSFCWIIRTDPLTPVVQIKDVEMKIQENGKIKIEVADENNTYTIETKKDLSTFTHQFKNKEKRVKMVVNKNNIEIE